MHLRNLYLYGMGVKSDPAKADQLLTKACSGLSAAACDQLKQAQ
jgi:TPR repeat protein